VTRRVARPTGTPPPPRAEHDGVEVALAPLAEETARRHLARHPEDVERYGDLALEWAVHDMQYALAWAFGDASGLVDLDAQVAWLARVLDARGYPRANLADCLRTAAEVVADEYPDVAERLAAVAVA
jgi:hypothetical protein